MALFGWIKKKDAPQDNGDTTTAVETQDTAVPKSKEKPKKEKKAENVPDPRKARRFFDYAQTVSDSRNYDYAIVCWINGLKHDPENMTAHEKLLDVARRRMVAGGKGAGLRQKRNMPGGRTPIDKMLAAEFLWAHDPLNTALATQVMEHAVKAEMYEVAYWASQFVLETNDAQDKPNRQIYERVKAAATEMKAWDRAVEAQRRLLMLAPGNMALAQALKHLEAEATVSVGGYAEGGNFRRAIKDADKQKALEQEDAIAATDSQVDAKIERARQDYEQERDNIDKLEKLTRALLNRQTEEAENEAIGCLQEAFDRTSTYRLKMEIGNIRMKQYTRKLRGLRKQIEAAQVEATRKKLTEQFQAIRAEQLAFELDEFNERCRNYPTQMDLRFHLGVRQFMAGDIDKAIASFQDAKADAKVKIQAMRYLGEAFIRKRWFEEAIDTFNKAIDDYPVADDKLALGLRYDKMLALEAKARRDRSLSVAEEALKVASQIAQADFNFRDIQHHKETLSKLVTDLRGG